MRHTPTPLLAFVRLMLAAALTPVLAGAAAAQTTLTYNISKTQVVENKTEKPERDTLERFPVLPPQRSYPQGSALHLFLPYDATTEGVLTDDSPYGSAS